MRALLRRHGDVALLALATLPLSIAVTQLGVRSGIAPAVLMFSSMMVFSAALQVTAYQLGSAGTAGAMLWLSAAMMPLRILLYSLALSRHMRGMSTPRRVLALFFLTDISFLEFQRHLPNGEPDALRRFAVVSRALWASWQLGTIVGLAVDVSWWPLPREGIGVLVFGCIALSQWQRKERSAGGRARRA